MPDILDEFRRFLHVSPSLRWFSRWCRSSRRWLPQPPVQMDLRGDPGQARLRPNLRNQTHCRRIISKRRNWQHSSGASNQVPHRVRVGFKGGGKETFSSKSATLDGAFSRTICGELRLSRIRVLFRGAFSPPKALRSLERTHEQPL